MKRMWLAIAQIQCPTTQNDNPKVHASKINFYTCEENAEKISPSRTCWCRAYQYR
jgi:hypothetical protein